MAELVDARDLKSLDRIGHAGSSPALGSLISYIYVRVSTGEAMVRVP
jgi:hypothetical protein